MTSSSVTILIPTHARTALLQEALWCALNQTVTARIIVLNDCPRQTLVCDNPLVTLVNLSERIATLGEKRNELLHLAETEWVVWLDDDDWLLPWYIEDLTKTISGGLDAIFTTRCWHAYGGNNDGLVRWQHGTALISCAVHRQSARAFGGFPADIDFGEDRAFLAELVSRGRTCSLLARSGYCYRWDNGVYHTSGLNDDPLSGVGFGRDAEFRLTHGFEPSGRIILSPSLRYEYFNSCPERREAGWQSLFLLKPQKSSLQRTIVFADHEFRLVYPPQVETIVHQVFRDFEQGQERLPAESLVVQFDQATGRYSLSYPGLQEKSGILLHDLGRQLLIYADTALLAGFTAGLAIHAGAVSKGEKAIVLPGSAGVGKSFLTAWLLCQSFSYLTDNFACLSGEDATIRGMRHPLSWKKSGTSHLGQLLTLDTYREDIIEGATADLIPWRQFSCPDKVGEGVSAALLIFPEFRSGAELSLEALSPAQAALLLMASVANGRNLPGHGIPHVSRVCKGLPALRLIYGDFRQLSGVLDRIITIVLDYNLAPADLVTLTAPFNRNRHLEELALRSAKATSTPSPPRPEEAPAKSPVTFPVPQATPRGPVKKLTIGMATYDDYDGVYFTVQALRLYHAEIADEIEILVIDNHPDGPCAEALKKLDTAVPGYRYVPEQGMSGTAVRDIIFREAGGEFVLCMDCHVLVVPGALQKLLEYCDAHPGCRDLLQGPLVYDDLEKVSTHFQPIWRKGMYGAWETDERGRKSDSVPFDIPMQGLGLFCCRREAWPGFNPRFRGFGGEEGYIHEKIRRNGGRTLCLPFLRWLHRFARPRGVPYRNRWEDRIHNYLVGSHELGLDPKPVEDHFAEQLGKEAAGRICDSIRKEMQSPFFFFDAIYCITLDTASARWEAMLSRLRALGLAESVRIFKAVAVPENHHIGCALSHRGIIAEAQRQRLGNVLVFEDDALFLDETLHCLAGSIDELKRQDWHVFYLGGHKWGRTFPLADDCLCLTRPEGLTSTHAVAYHCTVFPKILGDLPDSPGEMSVWVREHAAIDQYLRKLDKLYLAEPVVATQAELIPQEEQRYRSRFLKAPSPTYKYEFSICAIFKNEATILQQWIEHHLLFGCQHFYLINNASSDGGESLLLPYIEKGLVDLVDEPGMYRQQFAYNEHFLEKICRETRWIGVVDIDEYLYPRNGFYDIKQVLGTYDGVDALAVPWLSFGSSSLRKQPENVIGSFLFRRDYDRRGWTSFKTITRTDALADSVMPRQASSDKCVLGIHSHRLKAGKRFMSTFMPADIELKGGDLPYYYDFKENNLSSAQLVINHYHTMSLEYYQQVKAKRPSACTPLYNIAEGNMDYFNENDINDTRDETLKDLTRSHPGKS